MSAMDRFSESVGRDLPEYGQFRYEAMDECEQALNLIQLCNAAGTGGLHELVFPVFFRELLEK